jgi:GT2 family glycosyltransferase
MQVTAVTVTYGDRFEFLKQVVEALTLERIDQIVIVLNGVEAHVAHRIHSLTTIFSNITFLDLPENTGSAHGFAEGMRLAQTLSPQFIWLLDDDNQPLSGSLTTLKSAWNSVKNKQTNFALLSYREDRSLYKKVIQTGNPFLMVGRPNSFLGFDLKKLLGVQPKVEVDPTVTQGKVGVAPYGGFFFEKKNLDTLGFPNRKFYLYGDDFDFSYRFTRRGIPIFLILESKLKDLETSFHLKEKKRRFKTRFFQTDSKKRLYYNLRNNIIFEQNFVTNRIVYSFNKILYFVILFPLFLMKPKHWWKFQLLFKAVKHARVFLKNKNA